MQLLVFLIFGLHNFLNRFGCLNSLSYYFSSWVVMRQIIMELQFLRSAVVPLNSQIMDHTSKEEPERRDEDQVLLLLHQFKDRLDLHLCVPLPSLHLHHQSQIHLEVGVRVIIRLPHHHHQCNLSQRYIELVETYPVTYRIDFTRYVVFLK